jgi:hypothetical protein
MQYIFKLIQRIISITDSVEVSKNQAPSEVLAPMKIRCYLPKFKTGGLAALIAIFQWQ